MSYPKHTWEHLERVTAEKMNNMEEGIAAADSAASQAQEAVDEYASRCLPPVTSTDAGKLLTASMVTTKGAVIVPEQEKMIQKNTYTVLDDADASLFTDGSSVIVSIASTSETVERTATVASGEISVADISAGVTITIAKDGNAIKAQCSGDGMMLGIERTIAVNLVNDSGVWGASDRQISITYADLKALRNAGELVNGATYRITDYVTKINGTYDLSSLGASGYLHIAKSAEHPYDIIVYAEDESTLSEVARVALHDGDTYFANANLDGWDIRYCLDNDTARFAWADATNGKGVVYWMRDEWGNEAWFDFKNVLNVRYALSADEYANDKSLAYDASEQPNRYGSPQHLFKALQAYMESGSYSSPLPSPYDFAVGANILGTVQMASLDATYLSTFSADLYYTFDYFDGTNHADASLNANAKVPVMDNVFAYESDSVTSLLTGSLKQIGLNGSVFETNSVFVSTLDSTNAARCVGNKIGTNAWYNTFGNACQMNELPDLCYNNTFGNYCYSNTFGQSDNNNELQGFIQSFKFGSHCGCIDVYRSWDNGAAQYYTFLDGVCGSPSECLQFSIQPSMVDQYYVGYNTAGNLIIWCPANLANPE